MAETVVGAGEDGSMPVEAKDLEGDEAQHGTGARGKTSPPIENGFGAFISCFTLLPPSSLEHQYASLAGLTFVVKDIFDVDGHVTGFGSPDWARTQKPAKRTAPVIQALLNAGATCIGKVHMDEMAYSILGQNAHYGTPVNPINPARIPGGSSSGSGVAVAAKLVDFSLGTDTGGSVRAPAACCGILGFRPSHGAVSAVGVTPMAQSLDTVGWFARDVAILCKVGQLLLHTESPQDLRPAKRFIIADDCFNMSIHANDKRLGIIYKSVTSLHGGEALQHVNLGQYIESEVYSLKEFREKMGENNAFGTLGSLDDVLSHILRWEFKMNYEEWVTTEKPNLGDDTAFRVKKALNTTSHMMTLALRVKEETRHAINELLKGDAILVMPTVPEPPPMLNAEGEALDRYRASAFALLSVSVLSSCCQVSIPTGLVDSGPVAVSLLAKQGSDHFLLHTTSALYTTIQKATNA
ncbi:hypothetical protein M758_9G157700 [Ceratodon purpureus]|nr:hypothetical protein M758_9G157700 [Ceratodon purpureus]